MTLVPRSFHSLFVCACALVLTAGGRVASAQNPVPPAPPTLTPRTGSGRYHDPAAAPTAAPAPTAAAAASPGGPPPAQAGPPVAASNDYVLSSSDTVEMTVFHEPDLSTQTRIGGDGTAQFPLIGEVKVGGMTVRDAREAIRRRYNADYLVEPQVYLNVVAYAARHFTLLGQVNRPGTYDFPGGEHLSLLEAVGMAGGFTRLADRGSVSVRRLVPGSQEKTIKVNAKKLTDSDGKAFDLSAGDVVTVGETWF